MEVGWGGLAPVGTGPSSNEGAARTKQIPAGEGSGKVRLGGRTANESNGLGVVRFGAGGETRAVSGWSSRHH